VNLPVDLKSITALLLVAACSGGLGAFFTMQNQMHDMSGSINLLSEKLDAKTQELSAQIKQVDANSQQRRQDTREEMINQLQNVHSEMSEMRQQIYKRP